MPAEWMEVLLLSFLIYHFVFIFYSPKEGPNNCHQTKLKVLLTHWCFVFLSAAGEWNLNYCSLHLTTFIVASTKLVQQGVKILKFIMSFSRLCSLGSEPA